MINNEKQIFNYLKNLTLLDIINILSNKNDIDNIDVYYTTKDLIDTYPNVFSKYKISKYIKEDNLPVIRNRKERLFLKSSIEDWLRNKNNL